MPGKMKECITKYKVSSFWTDSMS